LDALLGLRQRDAGDRRPKAVERFWLRRRVDRQERVREALLLDLGAIIFELHRQRRAEPELLRAKVAELTAVDDDLRELSDALGQGRDLPELTARGLVATCTSCAGIMGIRDRHCPSCGAAAGMVTASDGAGPIGETVDLPALDPAELEAALPDGQSPSASRQSPGTAEFEEIELEDIELDEADDTGDHGFLPDLDPVPAGESEPETPYTASAIVGGAPNAFAAPRAQQALVPKAQRTLRAGRRRARAWLAERRPEGP
jgi:hypothetical protein